jgi:hypothetical protein
VTMHEATSDRGGQVIVGYARNGRRACIGVHRREPEPGGILKSC